MKPKNPQPLITVKKLNVWYENVQALDNVSMSIPKNKITALIGPSGCGKSTFLRSLNRMLDLIPEARYSGAAKFRGQNILDPDIDVIALRRSIGMVFQTPTPFAKSIYDNIAYGLQVQGYKKNTPGKFFDLFSNRKLSADELEKSSHPLDQAVVRSQKEVALWDEVKERIHGSALRLSGGQQQRLCIARAIAVTPDVLLLDEPCSALDPISTHKIEQLLLKLKENYTIVIVTHNMHQARRISDFVGFFHLGKVEEFGKTRDIFERPKKQITANYVRGDFG